MKQNASECQEIITLQFNNLEPNPSAHVGGLSWWAKNNPGRKILCRLRQRGLTQRFRSIVPTTTWPTQENRDTRHNCSFHLIFSCLGKLTGDDFIGPIHVSKRLDPDPFSCSHWGRGRCSGELFVAVSATCVAWIYYRLNCAKPVGHQQSPTWRLNCRFR